MRVILGLFLLTNLVGLSACGPAFKPARMAWVPSDSAAPSIPGEKPGEDDGTSGPESEKPGAEQKKPETLIQPAKPSKEESGSDEEETQIPEEFDRRPPEPEKKRPILSLPGLIPPPDQKDIVETGRLVSTIYYSPVFDEDTMSCQESVRVPMRDMKGNNIMDVCPKTHSACGYQGSCVIKKNKVQQVWNVVDRIGGEDRFAPVSARCKFGYGVHDKKNRRSFCLQPYVTIAADLDIYSPGDVIFVPKARNLELPSGRRHDGYFLVADAGRLIKGKGRFDFFSGHQHWKDLQNPLAKIGLNSKTSDLEYHRVVGPEAETFKRTLKNVISLN